MGAANLDHYEIFSQEIIDRLDNVAERLENLTYNQATRKFNISESSITTHLHDGYYPAQLFDVIPKDDYDSTLVIQAEFSSNIDPNTIMHLIPLIGSLPTTRIIAFGRPSWSNRPNNFLYPQQRQNVSQGIFKDLAIPTLSYLKYNPREPIEKAIHAGFSLGGDIVPEIPIHAHTFDHSVDAIISADGVTGTQRRFAKLVLDFMSVELNAAKYTKEVSTPSFKDARRIAKSDRDFYPTVVLPSSIAIAKGLALGGMEQRLDKALSYNSSKHMKAVIFNCELSELADRKTMDRIRSSLANKHGSDRVLGLALNGLHHAVNDQIYANAAIILQGMELANLLN